jgi:RNase H-fold protein (predicted Holliday junction resolvase)
MHQLFRKLSKPSKVASVFDWHKLKGSTVLSLNIHRDRVGIAVAQHPSLERPCIELEPLKFTDKYYVSIDSACLERFSNIIEEYNVCGVVVGWPLQHDSGRMGAACGRVVYALEQLWDKSNGGSNGVLSRPFCLWDPGHIVPEQRKDPQKHVDEFGRCPNYGRTTDRDEYYASKEQYHEDELTVVCQVWNDFCREHWPELYLNSFTEPDALVEMKRPEKDHTDQFRAIASQKKIQRSSDSHRPAVSSSESSFASRGTS